MVCVPLMLLAKKLAILTRIVDRMAVIQIEDLSLGDPLGRGSYGLVSKCSHRDTGQPFALKTIEYQVQDSTYVQREIENLRKMHHRYITAYYTHDIIEISPTFHQARIVTELCSGGSLASTIIKSKTRLPTNLLVVWIRQLAEAICALHELGIVHRDIKAGNVLLTSLDFEQAEVKLCDLGLSRRCVELSKSTEGEDYMTPKVGTVINWAPEQFTNKYSLGVDVWSLGCLVFELCTFTPAFQSKENAELRRKHGEIKENGFKFPRNSIIHPLVQDFITKCCTYDQNERPTIQRILQHAMFQEASLDEHSESPLPIEQPTVSQQLPDINTLMNNSVALAQTNIRQIREFGQVFGPDVARRMATLYRSDLQGQVTIVKEMQTRLGPVADQWSAQLKASSQELVTYLTR